MASPARAVATQVLKRVAVDGAFAAAALDAELKRAGKIDARDAALATEIVYGTLRALPAIDAAIDTHLAKDPAKLDPLARAAMRAATHQVLHLGRVPVHAAVNDAVEIVRSSRGPKLGGLVNAVMRKVAAGRPAEPEPPRVLSVPPWLAARLRESLGDARAAAFLAARALPPPIGLRVREGIDRDEEMARLRAARPEAEIRAGSVSPRAILVRHAGDPRALPGYAEGHFAIQEEGAQAVAIAAEARPGERIADACAGRGGKTTYLAAIAEHVTAIDLHASKLERIGDELERLGLSRERVTVEAVDLSVGVAGMERQFDRVLVDAPCTGLGTVHRRPELLLRLGPGDPARMGELQLAILRNALKMVRPGGRLVYAVCSPMREEGTDVARAFEAAVGASLRRIEGEDGGFLRIGPWSDPEGQGPDAFQIARWDVV